MKVAFVYDRVNKLGGAERVLAALHEIWPQAPLYTAVYNANGAPWAQNFKVIPSFLQKFSFGGKFHELLPLLTPLAFEAFSFADYDVVISVTSAEAKYIICLPKTLHICYCLTPTRYLWSGFQDYIENPGFGLLNFAAKFVFFLSAPKLRTMDFMAAKRPDCYLAISRIVKARIKKYYRQDSGIIYPPVEVSKIKNKELNIKNIYKHEKYFLVVSRLVPYKKIDLIVQAFNDLGWNLKIIGIGNQLAGLKKIAKPNIEFLGQIQDQDLIAYYQNCQALVMAVEEDFGIAAVEVQATGKPVIAYQKGGVLETVIDGKTGIFFKKQTKEDLKLALLRFNKLKFKPSACFSNAGRFSKDSFIKEFKSFVEEKWRKHQLMMPKQ